MTSYLRPHTINWTVQKHPKIVWESFWENLLHFRLAIYFVDLITDCKNLPSIPNQSCEVMVSNIWKLWKRKKNPSHQQIYYKTCAQRFTLTPLRGDLFHSVQLRPHAVRDRKPCLRWQKQVAEGRCEMSQEAPALPFKRLESWRNWAAGHHIPDRLTQRSTWAAELSGDSARAASWLGSVWRCFVTDFLRSLKQNPACFFQVKSGLVNISTSKCFLLTRMCQYPVFFNS